MSKNKTDHLLLFKEGDNFTIMSEDGVEHTVQVVQDQGDGTVAVLIDGAIDAVPVAKETLQAMYNNYIQYPNIHSSTKGKIPQIKEDNKQDADDNKTTSKWLGCISGIVIALIFVGIGVFFVKYTASIKDSLKKKEKEDIRKIDQRLQQRKLWRQKHTIILTCDSDSIYHSTTICTRLICRYYSNDTINIDDYRITSLYEVSKLNYKKCRDCDEIENIYNEAFVEK